MRLVSLMNEMIIPLLYRLSFYVHGVYGLGLETG